MTLVKLDYPRRIRLQKGWEYDVIFRTGSRINGKLVRLLFLEVSQGETRFGLAVGRKQGDSVTRNLGRRKLKEAIRHLRTGIREGYWFVFSLSSLGLKANSREIYEEMFSLLRNNCLLKDEFSELSYNWRTRQ